MEEYMIKNIGWTLGNDCPCKCKHCYSFSVRKKGKNLTQEIVDKVIEQIPDKEQVLENYKYLFEKCDTVELSEPTLLGITNNDKIKGCACYIFNINLEYCDRSVLLFFISRAGWKSKCFSRNSI